MKRLRVSCDLEILNAKEFRRIWKSEGYDSPEEFLNDYLTLDNINQDLYEFDFEIKNIKFIKEKK